MSSAARCATFQAVVVAARGDGGGDRSARGQHGGHHRVGGVEQVEQSGSAVRSDAQYTGSARPPASSIALHSAST